MIYNYIYRFFVSDIVFVGMVENAGCGMRDTGCGVCGKCGVSGTCGVGGKCGVSGNAFMEAYTNKARVCLKIAHS